MVDPSSEDDGTLREWAPLSSLLSQIPSKAMRGLFSEDLNLTCIAALPEYLAIGTNQGLVYWYNRFTNQLLRLRCENTACAITCIAVTSTVDYMVAVGSSTSILTVFLIPKASPDDVPEVFKTNSRKEIERYTVGDLHAAPISAVEWSLNGMKLFSGNQKGVVVLTEIDYFMHLSKSAVIINEKDEIVQLSYNSNNQLLLVSTLCRTTLCQKSAHGGKWEVCQVGNKERKIFGRMGATFHCNPDNPRSPVIYCSRPGLRVWSANKEGVVQKTLMFKESVQSDHPLIHLLNNTNTRGKGSSSELQLGPLFMLNHSLLVTYTSAALLVLDPQTISVVAALYDVQKISALCVSESEIFILEGERHLIRIGYAPEYLHSTSEENSYHSTSEPSGAFTNQILELSTKLKDSSISSMIPLKKLSPIFSPSRSSGSSDGEQISECLEAQELPPIIAIDSLHAGSGIVPDLEVGEIPLKPSTSDNEVLAAQRNSIALQSRVPLHSEVFNDIANEQFEEVVFQPKKKRKSKIRNAVVSATGFESGSETTSVVSSTSENEDAFDGNGECGSVSSCHGAPLDRQAKLEAQADGKEKEGDIFLSKCLKSSVGGISEEHLSQPSTQLPFSIYSLRCESVFPSNPFNIERRNKEEIKEALAAGERLIARKYNLEAELGITSTKDVSCEECKTFNEELSENMTPMPETNRDIEDLSENSTSNPEAKSKKFSVEKAPQDFIDSIKIVPDGSEFFNHDKNSLCKDVQSDCIQLQSQSSSLDLEIHCGMKQTRIQMEPRDESSWLHFSTPKLLLDVAVSSSYTAAVDEQDTVYYCCVGSFGSKWQKADFKASQVSVSPTSVCVWRLHNNIAYALKGAANTGPQGEKWLQAAVNVKCISVGDDIAWLVTLDGNILCQKSLSRENPVSSSMNIDKPGEWPAVKISCFSQVVWLLTSTGEVFVRLGVSSVRPEGIDWRRVNIPVPGSVVNIALGSQRSGWIIDKNNTVMFSVDHVELEPHWWQVLISDYTFQKISSMQRLRSKLSKSLQYSCRDSFPCVACGKDSVWILQPSSNSLHVNRSEVTGHSWSRVKLKGSLKGVKWVSLTAEGIFESEGLLWLLSENGDLYCSDPYNYRNLKKVSLPTSEGAVCLAACLQALWLLTPSGKIYICHGLSDNNLEGNSWTDLCLTQIESVHLSHVSCGLDVVWACDKGGSVYMTVSSAHAMAKTTAIVAPVWIPLPDTTDDKKIFFIKVYVGQETFMVWALDNQGTIFVREGIFPDFPVGTGWVIVSGISAVELSVSATAVWALSVDGEVYKRQGISQNNYIGDCWQKVPGSMEALSASMCDRLWGIDKNGSLLLHNQLVFSLKSEMRPQAASDLAPPPKEEDWEII